jgi:hypothetical protein
MRSGAHGNGAIDAYCWIEVAQSSAAGRLNVSGGIPTLRSASKRELPREVQAAL